MSRPARAASLLVAVLTLAPAPAAAQLGGGPQTRASGAWPPVEAGVRFGYDYNSTGEVLGAQLWVAAIPSGHVQIVPAADVTFLNGLREYQAGVEAVVVSGGRRGGVYAGGGLAWRNSIYEGSGRETRRAPTVSVGARSGALFGAPFGTQLEMRWVLVDAATRPRLLTFGINLPLWGRGGR